MRTVKKSLVVALTLGLLVSPIPPKIDTASAAEASDTFKIIHMFQPVATAPPIDNGKWSKEEEKAAIDFREKTKQPNTKLPISIFDTRLQGVCETISDADCKIALDTIFAEYGVKTSIKSRTGQVFNINYRLFSERGWLVYGQPSDIINAFGFDNDFTTLSNGFFTSNGSKGEYRYAGYTVDGFVYANPQFPGKDITSVGITQRRFLSKPWLQPDETINSDYSPILTDWMMPDGCWLPYMGVPQKNSQGQPIFDNDGNPLLNEFSATEKSTRIRQWLGTTIDKYSGTAPLSWGYKDPLNDVRGSFGQANKVSGQIFILPNNQTSSIFDYAIINVPPTAYSPGLITLYHREYNTPNSKLMYDYTSDSMKSYEDFYDNFILPPLRVDPTTIVDDIKLDMVWSNSTPIGDAGSSFNLQAKILISSPGYNETPKYKTAKDLNVLDFTFASQVEDTKMPVYVNVIRNSDNKLLARNLVEVPVNGATPATVNVGTVNFPSTPNTQEVFVVTVEPADPDIKEINFTNNTTNHIRTSGNGETCECSVMNNSGARVQYKKTQNAYEFNLHVDGKLNGIKPEDIAYWQLTAKNVSKNKVLYQGKLNEGKAMLKFNSLLTLPASSLEYDAWGNSITNVSFEMTPYLKDGSPADGALCATTITIHTGPAVPDAPGPAPAPNNPPVVETPGGVDNIRITQVIPMPGNGALRPGQPIEYAIVAKADIPSSSTRLSFNGGTWSRYLPLNADVAAVIRQIDALDGVTVTNGAISVAPSAAGYDNARALMDALLLRYDVINATIYLQGQTCNIQLYRGGDEAYCTISGIMPDSRNESNTSNDYSKINVAASIIGVDVAEANIVDNTNSVTMYPVLPQAPVVSEPYVEAYNVDINNSGRLTKNSESNPAKFGQRIAIRLGANAGLKAMTKQYGYDVMQLYSELATTTYSENIPLTSVLKVQGDTPSAVNGVSTYIGNRAWKNADDVDPCICVNDFNNSGAVKDDGTRDGKQFQYIHKVTTAYKTYRVGAETLRWQTYQPYYANLNSADAKISVEWQTKSTDHWIVDLVQNDKTVVGFWPQHGTIPPLKDGVPTPISKGGKYQSVNLVFKYGDSLHSGTLTIPVYMFGSTTTVINT